jgi:hypothetical protein
MLRSATRFALVGVVVLGLAACPSSPAPPSPPLPPGVSSTGPSVPVPWPGQVSGSPANPPPVPAPGPGATITIGPGAGGTGVIVEGAPPLRGDPAACAAFQACCAPHQGQLTPAGLACGLTPAASNGDCAQSLQGIRGIFTEQHIALPPGCGP